VTAVYLALRFQRAKFQELLKFVIAVRGDVDTIAAMAGAMWGAKRGLTALPRELLDQVEDSERLLSLAGKLYALVQGEKLAV
jgi:poly(ADP-ribose) glycohydrolase ARH3